MRLRTEATDGLPHDEKIFHSLRPPRISRRVGLGIGAFLLGSGAVASGAATGLELAASSEAHTLSQQLHFGYDGPLTVDGKTVHGPYTQTQRSAYEKDFDADSVGYGGLAGMALIATGISTAAAAVTGALILDVGGTKADGSSGDVPPASPQGNADPVYLARRFKEPI